MTPPKQVGRASAAGAIRVLTTALERRPVVDLEDYGQRLAKRLPGFEIKELLGVGGMGAVYLATEKKFDRPVAIKVLLPPSDPSRASEWRQRFEAEARTMAKLQHDNILTVFDFGQDDELAWMVLEYVNGTNLRELLREGQLTQTEVLDIASQLGAALQHAHQRNVVHRDIKPENVLIDDEGHVKVADFGIAKVLDPDLESLTQTNQTLGSRVYIAPELMKIGATVDTRADVYAFGAVVYEMLTGSLSVGNFSPPSSTAGVDEELDEPILRALDPNPESRTSSIGDTLSAIRRLNRPVTEARREPARVLAARAAANELAVRQSWLAVAVCAVGIASLGMVWIRSESGPYTGWESGLGALIAAFLVLPIGLRIVLGTHHAHRIQALVDVLCGLVVAAFATRPWWLEGLAGYVAPGAWLASGCGAVLAIQALATLFLKRERLTDQQLEELVTSRRTGGAIRRDG
ncbi:protein kinase domain-containing protein [Engelhardtia mirabilis]